MAILAETFVIDGAIGIILRIRIGMKINFISRKFLKMVFGVSKENQFNEKSSKLAFIDGKINMNLLRFS